MELACDVLVVGSGCGEVAAALAATDLGRSVILTDLSSWVGGQLTSQAVPPDEHPWVESTGTTARYRQLRDSIRMRYKRTVRGYGCVQSCSVLRTVWRLRRTCAKAAESPLSLLSWRLT
jgi:glycine/D-amino acid oxidase-like deaminating enzyme